jgi:hypothetical protein
MSVWVIHGCVGAGCLRICMGVWEGGVYGRVWAYGSVWGCVGVWERRGVWVSVCGREVLYMGVWVDAACAVGSVYGWVGVLVAGEGGVYGCVCGCVGVWAYGCVWVYGCVGVEQHRSRWLGVDRSRAAAAEDVGDCVQEIVISPSLARQVWEEVFSWMVNEITQLY